MGKLTPEERAELEARLADDDADDDENDEVSLTFPDGHSFTGSYRRAKDVAAARGFKLKADPPADDDGKGKGKTGGTVTKGRFQAGRRVS